MTIKTVTLHTLLTVVIAVSLMTIYDWYKGKQVEQREQALYSCMNQKVTINEYAVHCTDDDGLSFMASYVATEPATEKFEIGLCDSMNKMIRAENYYKSLADKE